MGKAVRIGYAGVVLEGVEGGIGEAAAVFHHRRYAERCWQADDAPGQKTVGKAGGEVGNLVGADDGRRETTEGQCARMSPNLSWTLNPGVLIGGAVVAGAY